MQKDGHYPHNTLQCNIQVGGLFDWHCIISYADIGNKSSQQGIDYNAETY